MTGDAVIEEGAIVSATTTIWPGTVIRAGAQIAGRCIIGRDVYIDTDVKIDQLCKIQNGAQIFHPAIIESGVFVGPGAMLLNDRRPRATDYTRHNLAQEGADWTPIGVLVGHDASIGAGAIILPGIRIGHNAMVGAGAVVTHDVAPGDTVAGNPARSIPR